MGGKEKQETPSHRRPASSGQAESLRGLADVDRVVHEPARLLILMHLYTVEKADSLFLLNATELSWGNLSSHLSRLEEAGYVRIEKGFVGKKPHTMVQLTPAGRTALDSYRRTMRSALERRVE
jgi:DNA-binding MarR family transcriptional regulator